VGAVAVRKYMNNLKPTRLGILKKQANRIYKEFTGEISDVTAAGHFIKIPAFAGKTTAQLLQHKHLVQLKHAYTVVAMQNGFNNWAALRAFVIQQDCLYTPKGVRFVHAWFKDYTQAAAYRENNGGYLLCFWKDIIVCGNEYINCLNLSTYTEQWKAINYNWVKPANTTAWQFLFDKASLNYCSRQ